MTRAQGIGYTLAMVASVAVFVSAYAPQESRSDVATQMSGYAWSDTIGWISLGGATYGISIDASGALSGHAWSDNIGWISANSADLVGCPTSPCTARLQSGAFLGWLKAIGASGGWDGFISLAGPGYGVTESNGVFSGYAWGSEVVGWIDFAYTTPLLPSCSLSANPTTVVLGTNTTLSWTSYRATSGVITPGNVATTPVASGSAGAQPSATTTYTATFTGAGGSAQCSVEVGVRCAELYSCNANSIMYTSAGCQTSTVATCNAPTFCSAGQSTCQWPEISFNNSGDLSGHLQARPGIIAEGATTRLYWNVSNADSCTVSGGGQTWSTLTSGASGVETNPISEKTTYALDCYAYADHADSHETVDVLVQPHFQER